MKQLQINIDATSIDEDDFSSPPSSPPPAHLIYFPETYHYAGNNPNQGNQDTEKKGQRSIPYYAIILRRTLFNVAKTLIKFIFKNNNLLLFINIANSLWKQRLQFIRPTVHIAKQILFVVQHNSYKQCIKYLVHFMDYHFNKVFSKKQQMHLMTTAKNSSRSPLTTMVLMISTMTHLLAVITKLGSKWTQNFIKSLGGLDSIVLAICTIAFTKSLQSDRIF
ncbi:hypothetical protein MAM1_0247c08675 [Mucor ambiguus]|uniref:Uncharacterized protein n=1 Tax=Mucor ambiguus TaxID=91626 RepID=A0A0C9N3J2_9FUNG|nr:hypothetical protein MAM1_0247c08675 [Mucor ambiguus]